MPLASLRHWTRVLLSFSRSSLTVHPSLASALSPPACISPHLAIGLPWCFERAGTYDAIGYRISAGSLIGRSTAHGRSRSAPVTTDLLRKNVDSFYTLSCPTPDAPHSLHYFLSPSRASPSVTRSFHYRFLSFSLCRPPFARPVWPPLRRSSTHRHRPQQHHAR